MKTTKKMSLLAVGVFSFSMALASLPSTANAATLICTKCDRAYSDREVLAEGKGKEPCPQGGKHFFRPRDAAAPESTSEYQNTVTKLQGNWYSKDGALIAVQGNYLNGCRILSVGELAGGRSNFGATLYLDEAEGARKLRISVETTPEAGKDAFEDGTLTPRIRIDNVTYYKQ